MKPVILADTQQQVLISLPVKYRCNGRLNALYAPKYPSAHNSGSYMCTDTEFSSPCTPLLMCMPYEACSCDSRGRVQVLGRTLSVQFDGNWAAVEGVMVDKLGKYAYAIPGISSGPATPFILDVALDVRAKVRIHQLRLSL